jgi:hypothetical protein
MKKEMISKMRGEIADTTKLNYYGALWNVKL